MVLNTITRSSITKGIVVVKNPTARAHINYSISLLYRGYKAIRLYGTQCHGVLPSVQGSRRSDTSWVTQRSMYTQVTEVSKLLLR